MNEREARQIVRAAFGEAPYPPGLNSRARDALTARRSGGRLLRLVGPGLGAAIAIVLISVAFVAHALSTTGPASQHGSAVARTSTAPPVPLADARAAGLSQAAKLIVPFAVGGEGESSSQISLIGAYADTDRLVLFFRETGPKTLLHADLSDQQGTLNYAGRGGAGLPGDVFYALDGGPHPVNSHLAKLYISVSRYPGLGSSAMSQLPSAPWTFRITLPVNQGLNLKSPPPFGWANWPTTAERLEATPSVVHLQLLVRGASIDTMNSPSYSVTLLDPAGHVVQLRDRDARLAQGQTGASDTLVDYAWTRPVSSGLYTLRFSSPSGSYQIQVQIPALAS